jgi:hypothetical protein
MYVRTFMWELCGWGRVDTCMTFHMSAFYFFLYHCTFTCKFKNCATMNCQRNVNSILPTHLPHTFSYIFLWLEAKRATLKIVTFEKIVIAKSTITTLALLVIG